MDVATIGANGLARSTNSCHGPLGTYFAQIEAAMRSLRGRGSGRSLAFLLRRGVLECREMPMSSGWKDGSTHVLMSVVKYLTFMVDH